MCSEMFHKKFTSKQYDGCGTNHVFVLSQSESEIWNRKVSWGPARVGQWTRNVFLTIELSKNYHFLKRVSLGSHGRNTGCETLRTRQNVPASTVSWSHNPAR